MPLWTWQHGLLSHAEFLNWNKKRLKVSHMICEKPETTHIKHMPKDIEGMVHFCGEVVQIERTPQRLGGTRAWFLCPLCARRCAILYPVYCRKCMGLHYRSERLGLSDRAVLRTRRLRKRLGRASDDVTLPIPSKPKWMRWHTYFARLRQIQEADARRMAVLREFLKKYGGL